MTTTPITIRLKAVSKEEISILKQELDDFEYALFKTFKTAEQMLDAIILIDIALILWRKFRDKIESQIPVKGYSISLRSSEAAVLLKVCYFKNSNSGIYENSVKEKYKLILDKQLKNF